MDDYALYQRLGEVIGELKGATRRLDDVTTKLEEQDGRLKSLEESRAAAKGSLNGMKWLAATAFTIASTLGAERVVQMLTGLRV